MIVSAQDIRDNVQDNPFISDEGIEVINNTPDKVIEQAFEDNLDPEVWNLISMAMNRAAETIAGDK